jgi:penicillin amidase
VGLGALYGFLRLGLRLAAAGIRHRPPRVSVAERIAALPTTGLPIEAPVEIRWNQHLVPFVMARNDRDLAVALGLIHAHLRLAQMEMLRRIAYGRLAEILGAAAAPFDHGLRLLDLGRAVPAILAGLSAETREWLDGFVAGINHHLASGAPPPVEFELLGIAAEPWTITDVLTIGRLAAADIHWLFWLKLLPLRGAEDWPELWARLVQGEASMPTAALRGGAEALAPLLAFGRPGSNAVAVSGGRSASGHGWVVGDPQLSLSLPNTWLQAAYHSPSYNVAGLMIPGIPVVAIGRNPWLAWGGSNLIAASSELFDVSGLPAGEITERRVRLRVRWSRPREIVLRDTPYGPVISDAPVFRGVPGKPFALRWIGHTPSDEIGALLAMNRARDGAEFRAAAAGFAVPGQTFVYAERGGGIGRVPAAWLPRRPARAAPSLVSPIAADAAWESLATAADLPAEADPSCGFVVSANQRPPASEIPIGWFFAPSHRADRLTQLLRAGERLGLAELARLQTDVMAIAAATLRDRLCAALTPPPQGDALFDVLAAWDGRYDPDSAGALAFELVFARLSEAVVPDRRRALYTAVWDGRELLTEDIRRLSQPALAAALRKALREAGPAFRRWRRWGAAHRLRLWHPLGAMSVLGRRWRLIDWPWPGSSETVFKSAHGLVSGRHSATYGSNARYLFDLSDPDANRLVLLGGQDGHPGSAAFLDQAELFHRGGYVSVPLRPETARAAFPHATVLRPA